MSCKAQGWPWPTQARDLLAYVAFGALSLSLSAQTEVPPAAEANKSEYVRISEILIAVPQPCAPDQLDKARVKAEQLRSAIRHGQSFADVAKANSQGPSAGSGGELGYFGHGQLGTALEAIAFRMNIGDVSDVIRTKQGFLIMQVTDRRDKPPHKEESANNLRSLTSTPELEKYLKTLRKKIEEKWYESVPESAQKKTGKVAVDFLVHQDGTITGAKVSSSSGDGDLDTAVLMAFRKVHSLPPIPRSANADSLPLHFNFYYTGPVETSSNESRRL